jgi:hypothetical protein
MENNSISLKALLDLDQLANTKNEHGKITERRMFVRWEFKAIFGEHATLDRFVSRGVVENCGFGKFMVSNHGDKILDRASSMGK